MTSDSLLIGIDVGGTNTDSVLLDPSSFGTENRGVLAFHKAATTADVSDGISSALDHLFEDTHKYKKLDVLAITIGTTHFINAVIEQDTARLQPVAVLRLCGPYSKGSYPFSDFPPSLTRILKGYVGYVNGGNRVDGSKIQQLDESAILEHARKIKDLGIKAVAIVGIFSIIDKTQENRVVELVRLVIGDANIVASHEVSGIGFLARENASILNASIMAFAGKIIHSFTTSVRKLGFHCPILLTQNDGTVLTIEEARNAPIRTFSSGATNSMRGASFLCSREEATTGKSIMVVDVGGTTTDVGLLLPNGFPRQVSSHSVVGGVRMNFSMPHVESIGLGGGSIVRQVDGKVTIGPDSVGSDIITRGLVFGGDTTTATDVTLAAGSRSDDQSFKLGTVPVDKISQKFSNDYVASFSAALKHKLEMVIDRMRTSPDPLPVLLVGGGSFIAPLELDGASVVLRPPYYQVANAIGAAMGKLSALIQKIENLNHMGEKEAVIDRLTKQVTAEIVAKGALEESVKVVDLMYDPVPYVDRAYSFEIKVVGDVDYERVRAAYNSITSETKAEDDVYEGSSIYKQSKDLKEIVDEAELVDHESYTPLVNEDKEWIISETDLDYIRIGTYILGCGGGGTPFPIYLEMRNMIRDGAIIRVVSIENAHKKTEGKGTYVSVGFAGSPTVSDEQLTGDELVDACDALFKYINRTADGVFALEIGGGNGFMGMYLGSSTQLNIPVIDADLMGRAYPTHSQILPCALNEESVLEITSVSDGNGNKFLITLAQDDTYVEKMMRAALSQVGCHVGVVNTPMTSDDLVSETVHHSISTAWRIGKAVNLARQRTHFDQLSKYILNSVGGASAGREIFAGKIIGVEKKLFMGHVYGEVIIENENKDKLKIPFKNENIVAELQKAGSSEWETICSVPDLISVSYADSGEACGTPDYRYGLMVFVIAFAPNDLWISTEKSLAVGGPKGFGPAFEHIEYKPVGKYYKPVSVIDEYYSG